MHRALLAVVLGGIVFGMQSPAPGLTADVGASLRLSVPAQADVGVTVAVEFRLGKSVAAVDGRLYFDTSAAEVVGLAPVGGGTAFPPVEISGGVAVGAYGLKSEGGQTVMRVVVAPRTSGRLQLRLVIDAAADAMGNRLAVSGRRRTGTLRVGDGGQLVVAPAGGARLIALRPGGKTRDLIVDGHIGPMDMDVVRVGWELARANEIACGASADAQADANGDGCVDIVDVQAVAASQGRVIAAPLASSQTGLTFEPAVTALAVSAGPTFVVDSTLDNPDATPGDGLCADSSANCTLRAAITESNWWRGDNRIEFNLPGIAPVRIQLTNTATLLIQNRTGSLTIDGYSQPGAHANTAQFGSNAVMGVEIRGFGNSPRKPGLRITSPNNTIRGLLLNNHWRAIVVDGPDAQYNRIVGNWVGFNTNGSTASYNGDNNILLSSGASNNVVGAPSLADRNVSGRAVHAIGIYGPGTNGNVLQNNLLCTTPSGTSTAQCNTGIDHNFGPKFGLVGGTGPNERNIIGRTSLNGIEYSHGWDPDRIDTTATWQVNNNQAIGNWIGFRGDGSYDATFRSAQNNPGTADNGNGVNVYDGSNFNLIEGNYVASVWDGIQTMSPNATGNIIRGNIIGMSPLGQPAPLTRYGIVARLHTRGHFIESNVIRNTAGVALALTDPDVRFVRLSRNIVMDTAAAAIYLAPHPADPSTGANNLLAPPLITSATTIFVAGTGVVGATVEVYRASRPAGQSGLPVEYLGAAFVAPTGAWSLPVSIPEGTVVTALQIHPSNDTSALGTNVVAQFEALPPAPNADFESGQQASDLTVNFLDTSRDAPTAWSWGFGDGGSSTQQNPSWKYAAAGEYTVTLTASNAGGSSLRTRTVTVIAPPIPPGGFVAADTFSRTVSGGWGNAEIGGAYTTQGSANDYSVSSGVASIRLPSTGVSRSALLAGTSERDVDILFRVKADKVAAGGSYFIYAVARRNGQNEYRPRLIMNGNGSVSVGASALRSNAESSLGPAVVVPGLSQAAGSFIWLRTDVSGANPTTIRVKAWADGQPEPGAWQFSATDSTAALQSAGSVGLRIYVNNSVSNTPIDLSFDDYIVGGPPPPPPPPPAATYATDQFERVASNGWGSADTGGPYSLQGSPADFSVTGGTGQISVPSAGANRAAFLNGISRRDVDVTFSVRSDQLATGGAYYVYLLARHNGGNSYRPKIILNTNGTVAVHAGVVINNTESSLGPAVVVPGLVHTQNAFIWVRAQVSGADATTISVKAWADGQAEPAGWQFTATDSTAGVQVAGGVGLRVYLAGGVSNSPVLFQFDDYLVTETP